MFNDISKSILLKAWKPSHCLFRDPATTVKVEAARTLRLIRILAGSPTR
jgi:hypothetical protein